MNVYASHSANGGTDGRLGCVGVVFKYQDAVHLKWIVVKYDVHNRDNVYIVPFMHPAAYIPNPQDNDHLITNSYLAGYPDDYIHNPLDDDHPDDLVWNIGSIDDRDGDCVFLMNRATFVPVSEIGQCDVIKRDYPDARKLQQHMADLVNNMVCEVEESAPPRLRGGSVLKDEEGDKP